MTNTVGLLISIFLFVLGLLYLIIATGDLLGVLMVVAGLFMLGNYMAEVYHRRDK